MILFCVFQGDVTSHGNSCVVPALLAAAPDAPDTRMVPGTAADAHGPGGGAAAPKAKQALRRPAASPSAALIVPDGFDFFGCSKCKKKPHGCARCKAFANKGEKGYQWLNGSVVCKVPVNV